MRKKKSKIPDNFAIVDIETTGLHGIHDRIIELAILRIENNKLVDSYTTLINPQTYISPFIENFTGITKEELTGAPLFSDIKEKIMEFLDGAVFVAHNARFDYGFMRAEFKRAGISWSAKTLCTVKLSRRLFPTHRRHGLEALIERYGLKFENRHRAYDDAHVVWQFLNKLQKIVPENELFKAINIILKSSYSGSDAVRSQIEELPESPGVYMFYDDKNILLYVGKAKNIKDRVISHFSQDYTSARELEMMKNTSRIEYFQTAGELGALVEEARLIKQLKPVFNRKLKERKEYVIARKTTNTQGFYTLELNTVQSLDEVQMEDILGVFKNKRSAKEALLHLTETYSLCEKLMGLEKTKGSCFGYKIAKCKGACCGKEDKRLYNGRFVIAFATNQEFKPWPYKSAIEIIEKNEEDELYETFTIDNWRIVSGTKGGKILNHGGGFDLDTYKILVSYLKYKKPQLRILK